MHDYYDSNPDDEDLSDRSWIDDASYLAWLLDDDAS